MDEGQRMNTPELAELTRQDIADGVAQQVVRAVIKHEHRILLQQPTDGFRSGTWELPTGDPGDGAVYRPR